jgi:putative membrane protein
MLAAAVSALHVLALGIGLGAVWVRGRALRALAAGGTDVDRVLGADNAWGAAAMLWLATGLGRVFGELDKGTDFYLYNGMFWVKMALFGAVFLIELVPMITFIRWRIAKGKKLPIDTSSAGRLARLNTIEVALVLVIPFVAAMMVRAVWLLGGA